MVRADCHRKYSDVSFKLPAAVPFKWEAEPGKPIEPSKTEPHVGPLVPPPCIRARRLHAGQFKFGGYGPETVPSAGLHVSDKILQKVVGSQRLSNQPSCMSYLSLNAFKFIRKRGDCSSADLDRDSDDEEDYESSVSTVDHPGHPQLFLRLFWLRVSLTKSSSASATPSPPTSQLAPCLLSLTNRADIKPEDGTATDVDVVFAGPREAAWHQPEEEQYTVRSKGRPPTVGRRYGQTQGRSYAHERRASQGSRSPTAMQKQDITVPNYVMSPGRHQAKGASLTKSDGLPSMIDGLPSRMNRLNSSFNDR